MTALARVVVVAALVVWSFWTLTQLVIVLRDERRARLLDRHIDDALRQTQTPDEQPW